MAKGASSKPKKPAEKKGGDKGKGKSEEASEKGGKVRNIPRVGSAFFTSSCRPGSGFQGKGGLKAATAVNVRHILCEKHSKAMEALQRIQAR
jgi:NIMA-interacting peptidyl-prolyl cis-trans isomerase 4